MHPAVPQSPIRASTVQRPGSEVSPVSTGVACGIVFSVDAAAVTTGPFTAGAGSSTLRITVTVRPDEAAAAAAEDPEEEEEAAAAAEAPGLPFSQE